MSRTSTMLLLTGDYADRLDDLYRRAQEAATREERTPTPRRMDESPESVALRTEYEALKAEAEAAGVRVVLSTVGRKDWRELKLKHPPRVEGVDEETQRADRLAGVNVDSVEDDLVFRSLVEPAFVSRQAFDEWVDDLAEGDFQAILMRAWSLVNVPRVDPKSLPGSPTRTNASS